MYKSETRSVRALGILLFNLFFAWLCIFLLKVSIISGLFAESIMQIDLSGSELRKLRFLRDAMVDPSGESIWFFTAVLFCFASGAIICYRQMKLYESAGTYLAESTKFMRQNGTASIWWLSALSSALLISLPPFTSFDIKEFRKEKDVVERLYNTIEEEKEHVDFMMSTGKLPELKEEYPKLIDGQEISLTLDQTTLTSYSLNSPITSVPFTSKRSLAPRGISTLDKLQDIMLFPEKEVKERNIELEVDLGPEQGKSVAALGFALRASKNTCVGMEFYSELEGRRIAKLLLSHDNRRVCVKAGELKEVHIDVQRKDAPQKIRITLTAETPADIEISEAAATLVKNYKERYFHSSFCIEGKNLAYAKNIRSYLYIPSLSSLDAPVNSKPYSSLTCQQATLGKKFHYPYS